MLLVITSGGAASASEPQSSIHFSDLAQLRQEPNPDPIEYGNSVFVQSTSPTRILVTVRITGRNRNGTKFDRTKTVAVASKAKLKVGSTRFGALSNYHYAIVSAKKLKLDHMHRNS